jgi:hypothetical protein
MNKNDPGSNLFQPLGEERSDGLESYRIRARALGSPRLSKQKGGKHHLLYNEWFGLEQGS